MPRIPDLPGYLVPSGSDRAQQLKKVVSELCNLTNKSGHIVLLRFGFWLRSISNVQSVSWRSARQLHDARHPEIDQRRVSPHPPLSPNRVVPMK